MRIVVFTVLAGALLGVQGCGQEAKRPPSSEAKNLLPPDLCFSKGGLGIIHPDLYIDVKSAKNELLLAEGKRWTGKSAGKREVAIVFENRVWASPDLPNRFDLSKAVVVSFEGDMIRFVKYDGMSRGYYERHAKE
jgi:hypothetical protein